MTEENKAPEAELSPEELIEQAMEDMKAKVEEEPVEEVSNEEESAEPTQELTEIEQEAYAQGWRPDGGDKSAEQFLRDGPLYERIKERGTQVKKLAKQNEALKKQLDFITKEIYERSKKEHAQELQNLKAQKEEALELGDDDLAKEIEAHLNEQSAKVIEPPAAKAFKEKYSDILNLTVEEDQLVEVMELQDQLLRIDQLLGAKGLSPEKHLEQVEKIFLKKYKDNAFVKERYLDEELEPQEPIKGPSLSVEEPTRRVNRRSGKPSFKDLKPEYQHICTQLVNAGVLTQEEYVKELVVSGNIKNATKS